MIDEDRELAAALGDRMNGQEQRVMGDRTNAGAWRVARLKFDGENKSEFLDKFPRIATHWELNDHFAPDVRVPEDAQQRAVWQKADQDAISLLEYHVSEDVFRNCKFSANQSASQIYAALTELYLTADLRSRVDILQDLQRCVKQVNEDLQHWFSRLNSLFLELEYAGYPNLDDDFRKVEAVEMTSIDIMQLIVELNVV